MQQILIKNFTKSDKAISANDGEKVYLKIIESFEKDEKVLLDFEGIVLTITAFLNSSIGKLYANYNSEQLRNLLDIQNLKNDDVQLLKYVIDNAKKRFNKEYPTAEENIDFVNED